MSPKVLRFVVTVPIRVRDREELARVVGEMIFRLKTATAAALLYSDASRDGEVEVRLEDP